MSSFDAVVNQLQKNNQNEVARDSRQTDMATQQTEAINKTNEKIDTLNKNMGTQQTEAIEETNKKLDTLNKNIENLPSEPSKPVANGNGNGDKPKPTKPEISDNGNGNGVIDSPDKGKSSASDDEKQQDRMKALADAISNSKVFQFLNKQLGKISGFFGGLVKGATDKGKGILSTLFKAAGLGLLVAFLNSDTFKNFFSKENIERFQTAIADMMDYFKNLFDKVFTEENKAALKEKFDGIVESFKNIFNAFFDEEGNFTLFGGLKQIAIELGLIKDGVDKDGEEVKGIMAIIEDNPIKTFFVTIGATWLAIKGAFSLLSTGASKLLEKMGLKTPKPTVGPPGGGGPGTASPGAGPQKLLKPGTVNPKTRMLVGIDGKDTTVKEGSKGFKAAQDRVKQLAPKGMLGQVKTPQLQGPPGGGGPGTQAASSPKPSMASRAGGLAKNIPKGAMKLLGGFLKRVPFLGQLFSLASLYNILGDENMSIREKTEGIAGILGGLGGSVLGAIGGSILGTLIPLPFTGPLLGMTGGALGYFFGEEIALAAAQYLTGSTIDAFNGVKESVGGFFSGIFGGGDKNSQRLSGRNKRGAMMSQMTDTEKVAALNAQFAEMSPEQRNLAMAGGGANGGGNVTVVNSINKGGDSMTNLTQQNEMIMNMAMSGMPDYEGSP